MDYDWSSDPIHKFPFNQEINDTLNRLSYLLKLADNYNYLISLGMEDYDSRELIKHMESKNLSLESYRN